MTSNIYNLPAGYSSSGRENYEEQTNTYDHINHLHNDNRNKEKFEEQSKAHENINDVQSSSHDKATYAPQSGDYVNFFFSQRNETEVNDKNKKVVKIRKFVLASFVLSSISFALIGGMFVMFFSLSNSFFQNQNELHNEVMKELVELQNKTMKQIDQLNTSTNLLQQGFIELDDGWVSPFNGYQYNYIRTYQTWTTARATCHGMGGDLASFGIRNIVTRKILKEVLKFCDVWIGLNDISREGTWRYVTSYPSDGGDLAYSFTALWNASQPNNHTDYDCALMQHDKNLFSYSVNCSWTSHILCEKPV